MVDDDNDVNEQDHNQVCMTTDSLNSSDYQDDVSA